MITDIGSIAQYTQYTINNYTGQLPFHTEWDSGPSLWECTSQHDPPTAIRLQVAWSNPNDQKQGNDHLRFVNKKCFFRSKSIFEKKLSIWTMEPAICDLHLCDLHLWNSMPEWAIYGIQNVFHRVQLFGRFPRCPSVRRLYPATSVFSKDSLVKTSLPASSPSFEPFKRRVRWTMQTNRWFDAIQNLVEQIPNKISDFKSHTRPEIVSYEVVNLASFRRLCSLLLSLFFCIFGFTRLSVLRKAASTLGQ